MSVEEVESGKKKEKDVVVGDEFQFSKSFWCES